jgi:hypothetical protein
MAGEFNRRWPIACLGGVTGFENSGGNYWPVQCSNISGFTSVLPQDMAALNIVVRPGEAASNGESGWNLIQTRTATAPFAGGFDDFGSPLSQTVNPNNAYNALWDRGRMAEVIVVARTAAVAANPDQWRIIGIDSNNAEASVLGPTIGNALDLDQAKADRVFKCPAYSVGTSPTFNTRGRISTWTENEQGMVVTIGSIAFRLTDATRGIFWGYAGHGSWGIRNHSSAAGFSITADGTPYTGRYDDSALAASYEAHRWEIVILWIGANDAALTPAQFKAEIEAFVARHRSVAASNGLSPTFVLVSQYDLSNSNAITVGEASAMEDVAKSMADVEFVDLRQTVESRYGNYSKFSSFLHDSIHPSQATSGVGADFRQFMAESVWNILHTPISLAGLGMVTSKDSAYSNPTFGDRRTDNTTGSLSPAQARTSQGTSFKTPRITPPSAPGSRAFI